MLGQIILPTLWVIVDDGSTDKTCELLEQIEQKYCWIKCVYLKEQKEYLGAHIASVYNTGFEFAKDYSTKYNVKWEYIAILDSDTLPEPQYFEKCIKECESDQKLGIVSGSTCDLIENIFDELSNKKINITDYEFWNTYPFTFENNQVRDDLPMGSARLWRRECFDETGGGYDYVHIPDTISTVKAKINGWKTKCCPRIKLIERRGSTAIGKWYGHEERGASNYVIGLPLTLIILKTLNYSFQKPYYIGIAYLSGYLKFFIYRKKKVDNLEVRKYYRTMHFKKTKKYYIGKFKQIFNNNSLE